MARSPHTAKVDEARIAQRRQKVAANLVGGLSYHEMAAALDCSVGTIAGDVRFVLDRWKETALESVDEHVQLEIIRLDKALNAIWNEVLTGHLGAIDRFIRLSERRSKLLGLDAPSRNEWSGPDGSPLRVDNVSLTDEERAERVAAILELARARSAGRAAEVGPD